MRATARCRAPRFDAADAAADRGRALLPRHRRRAARRRHAPRSTRPGADARDRRGAGRAGAADRDPARQPLGRFDGYVALGCVIRGETTHYETVCNDSSRGLTLLGLDGLCIGNGILTVENHEQAAVRADPAGQNKGGGAAEAALHLIALARRFAPPAAPAARGQLPRRRDSGTRPEMAPGQPPRLTAAQARRMRSAARFYAVQALFQMEAADAGLETVLEEFETHRLGAEIDGATYAEPDLAHFRAPGRGGGDRAGADRPADPSGAGRALADRPDRPDAARAVPRRRRRARRHRHAAEGDDHRISSTWRRPSTPTARRRSSSTACSTTWRAPPSRRPSPDLIPARAEPDLLKGIPKAVAA